MGMQNRERTFVTALLSAESLECLDRYISEKAPEKTRSDILRDAFEEWCHEHGLPAPQSARWQRSNR
jgi:hypothetical protein